MGMQRTLCESFLRNARTFRTINSPSCNENTGLGMPRILFTVLQSYVPKIKLSSLFPVQSLDFCD
jgi:hypothetical protein